MWSSYEQTCIIERRGTRGFGITVLNQGSGGLLMWGSGVWSARATGASEWMFLAVAFRAQWNSENATPQHTHT